MPQHFLGGGQRGRLVLELEHRRKQRTGLEGAEALFVRASRSRAVGNERFEFLGAHEEGFGPFEACSLFSPMFQFEDQAAALATAEEVLRQPDQVHEPGRHQHAHGARSVTRARIGLEAHRRDAQRLVQHGHALHAR
ncbi:MAG: [NiFe]-hydrogenase assembly chaperone HybE, partial [Burkholderiaceae bacterium]